ncbi:hypothetical protein [Streptomyces sp. SID5910]|uniref:hypothetical protein n=1 Tax=Streptomyces sp. SID5910 TaxID=2690312 RepID=UPI0013707B5B|nr:hypothetical protein [Streptomyces sp. SID5910]MYR46616.1 hypothetical protein [Streptomyces sp. SID5910]
MKPTAQRRRDRRDLLDNLLSRALRGNLTTAEAALMVESVREEQRAYDQTRRSLAETGTAYGKHRAAADDAIRELEQRALDAEEQLTAYRSVLGPRPLDRIRDAQRRAEQAEAEVEGYRAAEKYRQAAADTFAGRLDAIRQQTAEGLAEGFEELTKRAEQAEELQRAAHQCSNDAEAARAEAEQQLAEQRQALATALHAHGDHEWPALIDWAAQAHEWAARAAVKADRKRVEELEHERAVIAAALHDARHKANRYRLAWYACRRDRKADRAAMAAERPIVEAAHRAAAHGSELFAAGRTKADREIGRRILSAFAFRREFQARATVADEYADIVRATLAELCPDDCPCRAVCLAVYP